MLRVNDFFCGAGGIGLGFKAAGFRLAGAWDFNKCAVESYGHNISPKVKHADITELTRRHIPYADVWTFGFPCQDISIAGKQAGMVKGKTRSGLFYEIMRLLEEIEQYDEHQLPSILLAENVKAVHPFLPEIQKEYEKRGYQLYVTLYNSKYWGVPQNRERYFMVGVHKNIQRPFRFNAQPTRPIPPLADILEKQVEDKYYIDPEKAESIMAQLSKNGSFTSLSSPTNPLLLLPETRPGYIHVIGRLDIRGQDNVRRVYHPLGIAPTLTASEGGNRQPKIIEAHSVENEATALPVLPHHSSYKWRIRKLTPREYARLQGFPDTYKQVVSDTQFYKQMGNAVTVPVALAIAEQIFDFLTT